MYVGPGDYELDK